MEKRYLAMWSKHVTWCITVSPVFRLVRGAWRQIKPLARKKRPRELLGATEKHSKGGTHESRLQDFTQPRHAMYKTILQIKLCIDLSPTTLYIICPSGR